MDQVWRPGPSLHYSPSVSLVVVALMPAVPPYRPAVHLLYTSVHHRQSDLPYTDRTPTTDHRQTCCTLRGPPLGTSVGHAGTGSLVPPWVMPVVNIYASLYLLAEKPVIPT